MNKHFHYYCIRTLAKEAGFTVEEADIIAYASQYVDDATEHTGFDIRDAPPEAEDQHIAGRFEPVCTAHEGIQYLTWLNADVQRKIYIPFHFIPPNGYACHGPYEYRVQEDSPMAKQLLGTATDLFQNGDRLRALIKTGIALHTYADTWAHQRFSGRHSSEDNDIQDRHVSVGGNWQSLGFVERMVLDFLPDVGHAEAAHLPDSAELTWKYKHDKSGQVFTRDNTVIFTSAAMQILSALCGVTGKKLPAIHARVHKCLAADGGGTHSWNDWASEFPDAFPAHVPDYDKLRWRREALDGTHHDWDRYRSEEQFKSLQFTHNGDVKWFLFHAEAGKQRDYVLRRIRFDLQ